MREELIDLLRDVVDRLKTSEIHESEALQEIVYFFEESQKTA